MTYSFRTNGNYIDFVHTDNTNQAVESVLRSLHNTSRCVTWSLPEDTTRISFVVDDIRVDNFPLSEIDFDGTPIDSQDDFETGIEAAFPGLAGGGEGAASYLVYSARLEQASTSAPTATVFENTLGGTVVWSRDDVGVYFGTLAGVFTADKTFVMLSSVVGLAQCGRSDSNKVFVESYLPDFAPSDDIVLGSIEIRVYP